MRLRSLPDNVTQAVQDLFPKVQVQGVAVDRAATVDLFQSRLKVVGTQAAKSALRRAALRGLENPHELARLAGGKAVVNEVRMARLKLRASHDVEVAHLKSQASVKKAFDNMFAVEREHGVFSPQAVEARAQMQVIGAASKKVSERYHARFV